MGYRAQNGNVLKFRGGMQGKERGWLGIGAFAEF